MVIGFYRLLFGFLVFECDMRMHCLQSAIMEMVIKAFMSCK